MIPRRPEPELMLEPAQARAYAEADFAAPHEGFVDAFAEAFPGPVSGPVLDLGCGPGDVSLRFAARYPACEVDGLDGAPAMLAAGDALMAGHPAAPRVHLAEGCLPEARGPRAPYAAIISNSLLHHLHEPAVLWQAIVRDGAPGAAVFVMDLRRPDSEQTLKALVAQYAANDPDVLRRDFEHSLHAAFTPDEVRAQLADAGLDGFTVRATSDRHMVIFGQLPEAT
ncbi:MULTISPECIES: trans-aconitate 2-methyltransferase [unclassified Thioalkalivibrio]|uniref:class I SAM-dependent methyltransferase n=1 Tax=unclassified Thioalkalivibrio TaxID=2621013 RepID=UPI00036E1F8F|nr:MULTISPECIES: class I SAM-dependent methyltransferase [unclassified Thioalkalivibrio]